MAKCEHSAWLELWQGEAGPLLSHGWRLPQIIQDCPSPSEQYPQISLFLGRRLKEKALRTLCDSNYKGHRRKNAINIRTDNRSLRALHPRFFADCDPASKTLQEACLGHRACHQDHVLPLHSLPFPYDVHDLIFGRLLFMFVDVVCIFEEDFGGLDAVKNMLLTWAHIGSGSSLPHSVRPRVIVVVSQQTQSVTHDILNEKDFIFDLHMKEPSLYESFTEIHFCRLPSDELSSGAQFLSLRADISRQLHDARFARIQKQVLFSATHLGKLFKLATETLCASPLSPFDFIAAARQQNPLDGSFSSHLAEFLELAGKSRIPYEGISSHIASAILMDAYPPGMHC
jgi:hypothetical protein